jgi:hypothetical protein
MPAIESVLLEQRNANVTTPLFPVSVEAAPLGTTRASGLSPCAYPQLPQTAATFFEPEVRHGTEF